ncbi:hypothetical protein [Oleiagrimonas sp.]|jgi:hypothetical protein|uniref:hypothetical protein n=1 Tax=Oleiagrimonas sp. TaxID=2010330 RepID=UPI002611F0B2|nr:hypothetical protein [Oleiagrimonas sp.]MDA3912761.1 hypothetical protein [Oleiagrimonas sp.]
MNGYALIELLHVFFAIVWVGGGFTLLYAAEIARRKHGSSGVMAVVDIVALLGPPLFVPFSLLTVMFGAAAAWIGGEFSLLWVNLGLVGFAATFLNGILLIKPRAEKLSAMGAEMGKDHPGLVPLAENLLTIARFDYVILLLVVADMVLKPLPGNTWELATMDALLVIGMAFTLIPGMRRPPVVA